MNECMNIIYYIIKLPCALYLSLNRCMAKLRNKTVSDGSGILYYICTKVISKILEQTVSFKFLEK
jgi:hypothetical protein